MQNFTTRDGCTIAYRDTGAGEETLVLLHGWSQSQAMFDRLLGLLGPELRVITYDIRNHGESGRTDNGARIATLATDLNELLDHLGISQAHLLGHSMGASVLWSYIDQYGTERLRSLVILDQPSVCVTMPWMDPAEITQSGAILDFAGAEGFAQALLGADSATARRSFLTSMLTPDVPEDDFAWLYEENLKLAMPYGAKLLIDHVMQDWREVLPAIDVPTLVTGGEVSHVAPTSQEWIASRIPGAKLRIFSRTEGGAHFPFFESPKDFADVLVEFLSSATER
ncbi:alpha/beta fold hydrolase [Nonomuraea sp. NPDC049480]|uniref:alpha/beta fold hydrolase n=1 Tax=Nonomuraea sp. NPDC049480 TaxID=3364353 RepID=UPI0037AD254C